MTPPAPNTLSNEPLMLGTTRLDSHSAHGARRKEVVGASNSLYGIYSQRAGYVLFSLGSVLPVAFNPEHFHNIMHNQLTKGLAFKRQAHHLIVFNSTYFSLETGKGKVVHKESSWLKVPHN